VAKTTCLIEPKTIKRQHCFLIKTVEVDFLEGRIWHNTYFIAGETLAEKISRKNRIYLR
jgi:hypothetical protein